MMCHWTDSSTIYFILYLEEEEEGAGLPYPEVEEEEEEGAGLPYPEVEEGVGHPYPEGEGEGEEEEGHFGRGPKVVCLTSDFPPPSGQPSVSLPQP